jgi:hypothetical protein
VPAELATVILTSLFAAGAAPPDLPEPEMLEFLGSFETADGKWLDPTILDEKAVDTAPPVNAEDRS